MTIAILNDYIKEIAQIQFETEHSGRTHLENLFRKIIANDKITIIHEPKRDKGGRGAPDYKFMLNDDIIGYCETKKLGDDLNSIIESEQIKKYITLSDNLILTDYLRFIWIHQGIAKLDIRLCEKPALNNKLKLPESNFHELENFINLFINQEPEPITKANILAKSLANPTRTIKNEIAHSLTQSHKLKQNNELTAMHDIFKKNIFVEISDTEFADAFAQTLSYSLFLTKLNLTNPNIKLNLHNISQHTPTSFALIKDILRFINELDKYPNIKPYIERIFYIINITKIESLVSDLSFSAQQDKDPYIYFYEDFLKEYDPQIRVDAGVYYTPEPVVNAIINNIHDILIDEFALANGLANERVKILDFACGTGTFLLQIYRKILDSISPNNLNRKNIIKNHLLKQIYGFELLIPAYCVSHLKLSQYLRESAHYILQDNERIQVYLTNTLEYREKIVENALFEGFFPALSTEGKTAQEIKEDNDILVITGNPPYHGESKNNSDYILNLIKDYKPKDGDLLSQNIKFYDKICKSVKGKEQNIKWLRNDYVKFLRFAEDKMSRTGQGIVGVITSNSFLDSPIFRKMREHLMQTYHKIIIIDLHGNNNNKEKSPDGSPDQNVFDIQEGVAISFFIKNPQLKKSEQGVFHYDIYGKRQAKFAQINEIHYKRTPNQINPIAPFYEFVPRNEIQRNKYDKGISLREIFCNFGVGICTKRDHLVYQNNKQNLIGILDDFDNLDDRAIKEKYHINHESEGWKVIWAKNNIKKFGVKDNYIKICAYRPFDAKYTYYTNYNMGFLARPVYDVMKHFEKPNIGFCFVRNFKAVNYFDNVFITNKMIDLHYLKVGSAVAPLYLYHEHQEQPDANFHQSFRNMVNKKFNNPSAEQILAYIYAVMHAPSYRSANLESLKMDFPKIPFDIAPEEFYRLAELGQGLIDAHLMRVIPKILNAENQPIGEPNTDDTSKYDTKITKISHVAANNRLYFNKTSYFSDVSPEILNFTIGGYKVLLQYLKSRQDENIADELGHIRNIINICQYTLNIMQEIDKLIP